MTFLFVQITSGGQLLTADTIYMQSTQKTFSIALSRKMVPSARILVYCITPGGEVLADALSFHIDGIRTDGVSTFQQSLVFVSIDFFSIS